MASYEFPENCPICYTPVDAALAPPDPRTGIVCRCGVTLYPRVPHFRDPRRAATPEGHCYYPAGHYDLGQDRCSCGAPVDPRRRHTPEEAARREQHGGNR